MLDQPVGHGLQVSGITRRPRRPPSSTTTCRATPTTSKGFADGVQRGRDRSYPDCDGLAEASFYPDSSDHGSYRDGYVDGQWLAWDIGLIQQISRCLRPQASA